jgi:hypothetical protein
VIGVLRFVGIFNAAVWLGATVLFVFGLGPAASSQEMRELIGGRNYPYFSVAIGQIFTVPYLHLFLGCSVLALLHVAAEWLYLGKYPRRLWLGLLLGLSVYGLFQSYWMQPHLSAWNRVRFSAGGSSEAAGRAFRIWHATSAGGNALALGAVAIYLWRMANPPDPARFVSATKFRG